MNAVFNEPPKKFHNCNHRSRHWSLSPDLDESSPQSCRISLRPIPIFSFHLCLGIASGLFPLGLPTETLYALFSPPMRAA
jgi:hypothetical protein